MYQNSFIKKKILINRNNQRLGKTMVAVVNKLPATKRAY
jgi:hypothetical protein